MFPNCIKTKNEIKKILVSENFVDRCEFLLSALIYFITDPDLQHCLVQ